MTRGKLVEDGSPCIRRRLRRAGCALLVAGGTLAAWWSAGPAGEPAIAADPAGDPVIVAAGDIAGPWDEDEATAALLDALAPTMVLAIGDLAYHDGTEAEFAEYYDPTWGRHKAITKPIPGNHEYHQPGAMPYFNYFGAAAGEPGKGWYAFDHGGWRIYALNTNCDDVSCRAGSEQEQWLRADLAANPRACTLAMTHAPRFSSHEAEDRRYHRGVLPLYQAFYQASGDIWLAGHNHFYERLGLMDPIGNPDPAHGIRNFIVGTGGATLRGLGLPHPGSEVRNAETHGVIKLGLHELGYDWEFVPVAGQTFTDSGAEKCDTAAPAAPADVAASATGPHSVDLSWTAATDDAGVTGYDVLRDGVVLDSIGAVTGYTDTTASPDTTYEYTVVARDAAGNVSPASAGATVTTDPAPARHAFTPEADARVEQANPNVNFGTRTLRTDGGRDPAVESYLRFALSGLRGTVTRATLRLYANTGSVDGPTLYGLQGAWDESSVTWNTRPTRGTEPLGDVGAFADDRWIEYDVTALVAGDGTYEFALAQTGNDGVDMQQREGQNPPRLVVETGDPPPLRTSTFGATADARVEHADPRANFGTRSLRTDGGRDPVESYLRFSASGLTGKVTRATLRVYATTDSDDGPAVYGLHGAWHESTVTWDTRPARGTQPLADVGGVAEDRWIEYDVTAAVSGDGTYEFALAQSGLDGVDMRQRETEHGPQLVVETEG